MNYKKALLALQDKYFFKKASNFLPKDQIITPLPIIKKIIDKANIDWANPNLKICDPCCGSGGFLIYCLIKLLEAGHSEKYIIENMLFGTDINLECINFIEIFWKFNQYKHNIKASSILNKDWDFKNMQFDLIIMNPPYKIGGKVVKTATTYIKDTGEVINLMPLSQYKTGAFAYLKNFEFINTKTFKDADLQDSVGIGISKKNKTGMTWEALLFSTLDQNLIEFYNWNKLHNKNIYMTTANYKKPEAFNIDLDFVDSSRCYDTAHKHGYFPKTNFGYAFNVKKMDYQKIWRSDIGYIHFLTKRAKDNFCKFAYNWTDNKWECLMSKAICGVAASHGSKANYFSIPQIDWDTIDTNPLWIAGQYDEAVLDVMGLKWDTNKEKIIVK